MYPTFVLWPKRDPDHYKINMSVYEGAPACQQTTMGKQGPKLRLPGCQCDWKFCTGDQNFTTGRQWATSYFTAIGVSRHCKIYINFDFKPKQLQIKFTYSLQQLTFYLNAASAIKWKGISCVTLSYDNHTAYDRSESCRHFSAVSHYIRIAGAQANHVREIWHGCGLVWATW